jgi:hypothetical protein
MHFYNTKKIMLPRLKALVPLTVIVMADGLLFPPESQRLFNNERRNNRQLHLQLSSAIEYDGMLPRPNPDFVAMDVVHLCMGTLMDKGNKNDEGLKVCFEFSSDFLQAPFSGKLDAFIQHAKNPVFASLVQCTHYEILSIGPIIPGTSTRGAMQTCLMAVRSPGSEERRFLWTLQKERRPPRQHCWLVHEVLFVKNAFQLTL